MFHSFILWFRADEYRYVPTRIFKQVGLFETWIEAFVPKLKYSNHILRQITRVSTTETHSG